MSIASDALELGSGICEFRFIACEVLSQHRTCYNGARLAVSASCQARERAGRLPNMYSLARMLQLAGLAIPPLVIFAQLSDPDHFGTGEMLKFLLMAVGVFLLGYLLQRFGGGSSS